MYVRVHRGPRQIGGNLLEIGTDETRLLFDAGAGLPPDLKTEDAFELEGLTCGEPAFDWVFLTRHSDCCGLMGRLLPGIHVFAGDETRRILNAMADFANRPRPELYLGFRAGRSIQLDDIRVTPIAAEHSAGDADLFLVQADGKNVLYAGDFRPSEQVPAAVRGLLGESGRLDLLITGGIDVRPGKFRGEEWIKRRAAGRMRLYEGTVFILCASADEERVRAISTAAAWSGRTVCEAPVDAEALAKRPGRKAVFVRASMLPFIESYMDARLPEEEKSPLLLCAMWPGCAQTAAVKRLLDVCAERGISVEHLHTGRDTIRTLIDTLHPAALLPIRCEAEDRAELLNLHDSYLLLPDGERWEVGT